MKKILMPVVAGLALAALPEAAVQEPDRWHAHAYVDAPPLHCGVCGGSESWPIHHNYGAAQPSPASNPYDLLEEPPFGHHIKGQPDEGEWRCTCGYGDDEYHFDTAEQHIANVVLRARVNQEGKKDVRIPSDSNQSS